MKASRYPLSMLAGMTENERDWMASIAWGLGISVLLGLVGTLLTDGKEWIGWLFVPLAIPAIAIALALDSFGWGFDFIEGSPGGHDEAFFIVICLLTWWVGFTLLTRVGLRIRRIHGERS